MLSSDMPTRREALLALISVPAVAAALPVVPAKPTGLRVRQYADPRGVWHCTITNDTDGACYLTELYLTGGASIIDAD